MAILTQFEKNRKINFAWLALSFFNFDFDCYINFENESIFSHVLSTSGFGSNTAGIYNSANVFLSHVL